MFGDSFFTITPTGSLAKSLKGFRPHVWGFFFHREQFLPITILPSCFRPHVWGFFFHYKFGDTMFCVVTGVFVPMFGDSFFTSTENLLFANYSQKFSSPCLGILFSRKEPIMANEKSGVFVPMFGDSFFTFPSACPIQWTCMGCFRPHVWGFFFHKVGVKRTLQIHLFSSPCLGILFSLVGNVERAIQVGVFVPMFGDSFFTISGRRTDQRNSAVRFSSPCLGILFSLSMPMKAWKSADDVFVPMFGDSFFTMSLESMCSKLKERFRPHVWGFFFHTPTESISNA